MAASGLLALLDDISTIADDVATLTYAATKKTTGIVTDDMAVTAEQAIGIRREREIPVVLKVAAGSFFNKAIILVPGALLLNTFAPWSITPLLMIGGAYLCYEGVEKILHKVLPHDDHADGSDLATSDPVAYETSRVWGAIRTDLILSAEIVAISLGEVKDAKFWNQVAALYTIAVIMTVGVYGLVALLVKLDDMGEALVQRGGGAATIGKGMLVGIPYLMKGISWIGAVAMLLVGGHILLHGIPPLEHAVHDVVHGLHLPWPAEDLLGTVIDFGLGAVLGGLVLGVVTGVRALWPSKAAAGH